jgi:hypothetical protein
VTDILTATHFSAGRHGYTNARRGRKSQTIWLTMPGWIKLANDAFYYRFCYVQVYEVPPNHESNKEVFLFFVFQSVSRSNKANMNTPPLAAANGVCSRELGSTSMKEKVIERVLKYWQRLWEMDEASLLGMR